MRIPSDYMYIGIHRVTDWGGGGYAMHDGISDQLMNLCCTESDNQSPVSQQFDNLSSREMDVN